MSIFYGVYSFSGFLTCITSQDYSLLLQYKLCVQMCAVALLQHYFVVKNIMLLIMPQQPNSLKLKTTGTS